MNDTENTQEVLVVVSKLKNYIRAVSGFNTSASVAEVLSAAVRELCNTAIENAKKEGRKTVMDRDFTVGSCMTSTSTTTTSAAA